MIRTEKMNERSQKSAILAVIKKHKGLSNELREKLKELDQINQYSSGIFDGFTEDQLQLINSSISYNRAFSKEDKKILNDLASSYLLDRQRRFPTSKEITSATSLALDYFNCLEEIAKETTETLELLSEVYVDEILDSNGYTILDEIESNFYECSYNLSKLNDYLYSKKMNLPPVTAGRNDKTKMEALRRFVSSARHFYCDYTGEEITYSYDPIEEKPKSQFLDFCTELLEKVEENKHTIQHLKTVVRDFVEGINKNCVKK